MRLAILCAALEVAGLGCLAATAFLLAGVPAMLGTVGAELLAAGVLLERDPGQRRKRA